MRANLSKLLARSVHVGQEGQFHITHESDDHQTLPAEIPCQVYVLVEISLPGLSCTRQAGHVRLSGYLASAGVWPAARHVDRDFDTPLQHG